MSRISSGRSFGSGLSMTSVIRPGRVLFEMDGISEPQAMECLRLAATKLPIRTVFVRRGVTL